METTASARIAKEPGTWAVSIDLCDAYLHIPIKQDPESLSTLWWMEKYSSSSGDWEFPRCPGFHKFDGNCGLYIKRQGPTLIQYFDDYLKHRRSREELLIYMYLDKAWRSIIKPGLIPNTDKLELVPSQDFVFIGMHLSPDLGIVMVSKDTVNSMISLTFYLS